jgi:predicted lipase
MNLSLEEIKFVFTVVTAVLSAANWIYVWQSNRHRVTIERISGFEAHVDHRLDDHAERLARLEQDAKNAPNHDDIKRLHARIDEVATGLSNLSGQFAGANHTLTLIHEYLLKERKQ